MHDLLRHLLGIVSLEIDLIRWYDVELVQLGQLEKTVNDEVQDQGKVRQ